MDYSDSVPDPTYGEDLDFNVPRVINSLSASTDIMNRSPELKAIIIEAVHERNEKVQDRWAEIILKNVDKKQDEKKAIFQTDEEGKKLRRSHNKAIAMQELWTQAEKSAAKFTNK